MNVQDIYKLQLECVSSSGKRTTIEFTDKKKFKETLEGGDFAFPQKCGRETKVTVFYKKGFVSEKCTFDAEDYFRYIDKGQSDFSQKEQDELGQDFFALSDLTIPKFMEDIPNALDMPEFTMEDVTEAEFFNFPPISENLLDDKEAGLWSFHGMRRFRFELENLPFDLHDPDNKWQIEGNITKKNNEKLGANIEIEDLKIVDSKQVEKEAYLVEREGGRPVNLDSFHFSGLVDTDRMGRKFHDSIQQYQFFGEMKLVCRNTGSGIKTNAETCYTFPFHIFVNNTEYYAGEQIACPRLSKHPVSIDFGTSSSCVAVQKGKEIELLTLSSEKLLSEDEGINIYENPTNLMIFDWLALCRQWQNEHIDFPHFKQGSYENYLHEDKKVEYDVGYTVSETLENVQKESLNAILTQIKLLSESLEQGKDLSVSPVIKSDISVVNLVMSPYEQAADSLDAIAFYAYLLGRAINNPAENEIYTKFQITYPVKFNQALRDKLKTSIEYGLKKSIPLKLRDGVDKKGNPLFQVKMEYSEPVAYVGAICGTALKAEIDKPAMFAVYDFGGGTLDFSFGMFSVDKYGEGQVNIFGVDGDPDMGGERLIDRISYWIYEDNKDEMAKRNIPFLKPEDEQIPDNFPSSLLKPTSIAKANLRKMDAVFSRAIFQNRNGELEGKAIAKKDEPVQLWDSSNEPVQLTISFDALKIVGKLSDLITESIEMFRETMKKNFENNLDTVIELGGTYDLNDVVIFKSGNSSRSYLVETLMEEAFSSNRIEMIDEVADGINNKKYAITPKTGVAFGQLRLANFDLVLPEGTPFAWNVYFENKGNSEFYPVLEKNCKHKDWVLFGPMRRNQVEIYCSDSLVKERDDGDFFPILVEGTEETEDLRKAFLHLRVHDETTVEYCITDSDETPDSGLDVNTKQLIRIHASFQ